MFFSSNLENVNKGGANEVYYKEVFPHFIKIISDTLKTHPEALRNTLRAGFPSATNSEKFHQILEIPYQNERVEDLDQALGMSIS